MLMWYIPTSVIMIAMGVFGFLYTLINIKEKREQKLFTNELLVGALFLLSGMLFPFMYQAHSQNLPEGTLTFLWFSTSIILVAEVVLWTSVLLINHIKTRRDPNLMEDRDYAQFSVFFLENWEYDFKKDVERKFLHLLPVFVIFFFWTLGMILDGVGVLAIWGLDTYSFAFWLIITVGFAFCVMFMMADLARLNAYHALPDWARTWYKKSMKPDELNSYISSAPLVLSFVPFVFAPFPIFAAVSLITAGADAAASLIGKKYGKHRFPENSKKTIEGYIAGFSMTFLIVMMISGLYWAWMPIEMGLIVAMATMAAFLFLIIDVFAKNVTDNILNPILTGIGMWFIFLL